MPNLLLDLLFPRRSLTGGEGDLVTAAELAALRSAPVIVSERELRERGMTHLDRIVAAADYDAVPLLHRAIHMFKYRRVRGVGEALGCLIGDASALLSADHLIRPSAARSLTVSPSLAHKPHSPPHTVVRRARETPFGCGLRGSDCIVLCPVPLHWIRKFSRGFNQAELLARAVGQSREWEVENLLRRVRWTGSQVGRKREERLRGVRDAFAVRPGIAPPSHVILVDDLSTTGATLNECAKTLKTAGVKKVEGLVLALG